MECSSNLELFDLIDLNGGVPGCLRCGLCCSIVGHGGVWWEASHFGPSRTQSQPQSLTPTPEPA